MSEATVTLTEHASRHGFGAVLPEEIGISVSGRGERNGASDGTCRIAVRTARRIATMTCSCWQTPVLDAHPRRQSACPPATSSTR
jgi:hypothetical protein